MQTIDTQARTAPNSLPVHLTSADRLRSLDQFTSGADLAKAVKAYLQNDPEVRELIAEARKAGSFTIKEMDSHCGWGDARIIATPYGLRISIPHLEGPNGIYILTNQYLTMYEKQFDFRRLPDEVSRVFSARVQSPQPAVLDTNATSAAEAAARISIAPETGRQTDFMRRLDDLRFGLVEKLYAAGRMTMNASAVAGAIITAGAVGYGTWSFILATPNHYILNAVAATVLSPMMGLAVGAFGGIFSYLASNIVVFPVIYSLEAVLTAGSRRGPQSAG